MSQLLSTVTDLNNIFNNNSQLWNHFCWCDDNLDKLKCRLCSSEILIANFEDTKHYVGNLLEHVRGHIEANRDNNVISPKIASSHNASLNQTNIMDNNNYPPSINNITCPNSSNGAKINCSDESADFPVQAGHTNGSLERVIHGRQHNEMRPSPNNPPNHATMMNSKSASNNNNNTTNQSKTSRNSNQASRPRRTSNESIRPSLSQANQHSSPNKHNSNTLPYSRSSTANGLPRKPFNQTPSSHDLNSSIYNTILGDPDRLTLTSTKSMPSSSSMTKNFISRLNELSEPVKRKLKFWNKKSFQINQYDPTFKVIYLGNLGMQICSKDESCLDKPIKTLWNNYVVNMKTEIVMRLTICNSGLKAITRQHGLTQYWSNRLVYCCCHKNHPRIFAWIYRHEGKKMRQELRCHAVFCPSAEKASKMVTMLNQRLSMALQEFKREKKSNGQLVSSVNDDTTLHKLPRTIPLRRQILAKGSKNFRPPLDRSKSAPKLTSIQEEDDIVDDEDSQDELEFEEYFDNKDDDDSDDYEIDPSEWFGNNVPLDDQDYRQHEVRSDDGRPIINSNINNRSYDDYLEHYEEDELNGNISNGQDSTNNQDEMQDKNNDSIDSRPNPDESPRRGSSRSSANTPNKSFSSFQNDFEHHDSDEVQNEVREEELESEIMRLTDYLNSEHELSYTCKSKRKIDDHTIIDRPKTKPARIIRSDSVGNKNIKSLVGSNSSNSNEPTNPPRVPRNQPDRPQVNPPVRTTPSSSATDKNGSPITEDMYLSWRNDLVIR